MENVGLIPGTLLTLAWALLGGAALLLTRNHRATLSAQFRLFLVALAVRYGAALVIYEFGLLEVLRDEDGSGWIRGVLLSHNWEQQGLSLFDLPAALLEAYGSHNDGYRYLLGGLFFCTGLDSRLPAVSLNCLFGALTVVLTYRIARTLFHKESLAWRAAWFTCLLPSMVIWSAQTVKEPVIIFLETAAIYACVRLKLGQLRVGYVVTIAAATVLLFPFRFYAAYVTLVGTLLALAIPDLRRLARSPAAILGLVTLAGVVAFLAQGMARTEIEVDRYNLRFVENYRRGLAEHTGSGVETEHDLSTPTGFGLALVVGAAHLLLAPFPWQMAGGSVRMLGVLPEMILWWWLCARTLWRGLWVGVTRHFSAVLPLLLFLGGMGFLYALTFGNVGLVYRQRAQLLPWLLIFEALGADVLADLIRRRRAASLPKPPPARVRTPPADRSGSWNGTAGPRVVPPPEWAGAEPEPG